MVTIKFPHRLSIGNNSFVGKGTFIQASGNVIIGENVLIGPHCKIWSSNHNFSSIDKPINSQGHTFKKVIIEDDVWVGTGAIILSGSYLKKGTIIAAGSVVTKHFPEYSIIGGNPAKFIRSRIIE